MSSYSVKMITRVSFHGAPRWPRVGHMCSRNPVEEATDPGVGQAAARLGDLGHLVEQLLFARKQGLGRRIGQRPEGRRGRRLDLGLFLRLELFFTERGAVVVAVDGPGEQIEAAGAELCGLRVVLHRVPLPLHGPAVDAERAGEGLDRGEQALLQPGDQAGRPPPASAW